MKAKNIILAIVALGFGAAAGWFVAGLTGTTGVSPVEYNGQDVGRPSGVEPAAKSKRKAPIRSANDAGVQKRILERRIHYLEQVIRLAKEKRARTVDHVKSASNAELVDRLMKLPTQWAREEALEQLGVERM